MPGHPIKSSVRFVGPASPPPTPPPSPPSSASPPPFSPFLSDQPQLEPRMVRRRCSPSVTAADPPSPLPRSRRRRLSAADDAATAAVSDTDAVIVVLSTAIASSPLPLAPRIDTGADWSGLPPEILHLTSLFLTNIWDYLRFRAVCSSWRSSCTARRPQIPSLLLSYDPDTTARSFLDPSDFRINTIHIPEARGKWTYGTPHGWLVMLMENGKRPRYEVEVSLLNPITRDHIFLPPLPRFAVHMNEMSIMPSHICRHTKPFLTANPNSSSHEDFLALLIVYELVFCKLGGDAWTVVDVHVNRGIVVVDFTYFNGAFYVVHATSGITVVNATTLEKTYTAPTPRRRNTKDFYLVESSGDLLLLEIICSGSVPLTDVYKLDNSGMRLKWARVQDSIGDRALFVSYNRSSISLTAGDYIRSRGDLICYANMGANMSISDIVAGSTTRKPSYWQGSKGAQTVFNSLLGLTWFIPSLC